MPICADAGIVDVAVSVKFVVQGWKKILISADAGIVDVCIVISVESVMVFVASVNDGVGAIGTFNREMDVAGSLQTDTLISMRTRASGI